MLTANLRAKKNRRGKEKQRESVLRKVWWGWRSVRTGLWGFHCFPVFTCLRLLRLSAHQHRNNKKPQASLKTFHFCIPTAEVEAHLLPTQRRLFPNMFQRTAALLGPGERPIPAHLVETWRHSQRCFYSLLFTRGVSPGLSTPVIQTPRGKNGCDSQPGFPTGLPAGSGRLLSQRNRTRRSKSNNWLLIRAAGKIIYDGGVNFLCLAHWFLEENPPTTLDSEHLKLVKSWQQTEFHRLTSQAQTEGNVELKWILE